MSRHTDWCTETSAHLSDYSITACVPSGLAFHFRVLYTSSDLHAFSKNALLWSNFCLFFPSPAIYSFTKTWYTTFSLCWAFFFLASMMYNLFSSFCFVHGFHIVPKNEDSWPLMTHTTTRQYLKVLEIHGRLPLLYFDCGNRIKHKNVHTTADNKTYLNFVVLIRETITHFL